MVGLTAYSMESNPSGPSVEELKNNNKTIEAFSMAFNIFLFGSEGYGMKKHTMKYTDFLISIKTNKNEAYHNSLRKGFTKSRKHDSLHFNSPLHQLH